MKKIIYGLMMLFFLVPLTTFATNYGQLVFASTIIRHGDREPYYQLLKNPISWQWGIGNLTPAGMEQETVTGQYLRNEYINSTSTSTSLLPQIYNTQDVSVTADACNRVIQSTITAFETMYPPVQEPLYAGQPIAQQPLITQIPAITTLTSNVNMYINPNGVNSTIFNELLAKYAYTQSAYQAMNEKYSSKFSQYSEDFGQTITSIADLVTIGDNLNVRLIYNKPLPDGISSSEAADLANLSKWTEMEQFDTPELGDFMEGAFLQQVACNMNAAITGTAPYKYALYGGHDSNLLAILGALGIGQTDPDMYPTYAGFLDFQLYNNNGQYTVVVNYCANNCQLSNNYASKTCSVVLSKTFSLNDFTAIANQAALNQWNDLSAYYSNEVMNLSLVGISNYISQEAPLTGNNYNYFALSSIDTLSQVK